MNREYHKWWSPRLCRDMELLVFGHAGAKVLVFPTRGARFYEYEQLGMTRVLSEKLEKGWIQLFCLDSIDAESLYCWWAHPAGRIQRHIQYEQYIIHEVFPFMNSKNPHECVISHGCSLGAFHASNIAFKYPQLFKKLVAFSGRFDLTMRVDCFRDLFDGYYDENVYFNTPAHFLPNLQHDHLVQSLRNMDIVITIGEEDPFRMNNEYISRVLTEKEIDHRFYVWKDRAHSGYYWRRMAPLYI